MNDDRDISLLVQSMDTPSIPVEECSHTEQVAAYVDGGLTGEVLNRFESHLPGCRQCLSIVGTLLRDVDKGLYGPPPQKWIEQAKRFGRAPADTRRPPWRWAAAAVMVMALGSALLWFHVAEPIRNKSRSPELASPGFESRIVRGPESRFEGLEVLKPNEGAVVSSGGFEIRWSQVPQARYYSVTIVTESGDQVWQERSEESAILAPTTVSLLPGMTYYLQVQAHLLEARTLKSAHIEFTLRE